MIFELYLSGDRRKRDLFSLFHTNQLRTRRQDLGDVSSLGTRGGGRARAESADAVRTRPESTEVVGRGRANSADIDGAGGNEEHFREVFRVMQELDMIAEDSPCTFQDEGPMQKGNQTGEAKDGVGPSGQQTRELPDESRGAPGTSEGGWSLRTRSVVRAGSVRYSRPKSSGGSSGFYRDMGNLGDDNWQSITGAAPDLAPRLPIEWTNAHTQLSESPQHLAPTASVLTGDVPGGRDSGGGDGFSSRSMRSFSGANVAGAGAGGGTGLPDNSLGVSARVGLSRGVSGREGIVVGEALDGVVMEGPAAAAAASAVLYGTGWPGAGNVPSKSLAIRRDAPSGEWSSGLKASSTRSRGGRLGGLPRFSSNGISSRLLSVVTKGEDDNAPRLRLSGHAVRAGCLRCRRRFF